MSIDKVGIRVMNCPPLLSSYDKTTYDWIPTPQLYVMPCKLLNPNELAIKAEYVRQKTLKRKGTGLKNVNFSIGIQRLTI